MTEEASDVVVAGSGAAGMMATLRAATGGAQVTVLEASDLFGGTTAISGGGMWLPMTHMAIEAGVSDSPELVKEYLTYLTHDVTDPVVIDRFIATAPKIIDFLEENTALTFYVDLERPDYKDNFPGGLQYGRLVAPNLYELCRLGELRSKLRQPDWEARTGGIRSGVGMEAVTQQEMQQYEERGDPLGWVELSRERVAKGIVPRGCALIGGMLEKVAELGGRLHTRARALDLTIEDGRVTGIVAEVEGMTKVFPARKGVVVASGGFEHNRQLWDVLVRIPDVTPLSPGGFNRGDSLKLAQQAGARLGLLDQVWWAVNGGNQPGQLVVNKAGKRFVNEGITYNDYGKVVGYFDPHTYTFPNIPAYVISNRPLQLADTDVNALGSAASANANGAQAPTLRELAEKLGVDANNLESTVAAFDEYASTGVDRQFGRGIAGWDRWRKYDASLPNPTMARVDNGGPYWAQKLAVRCFGTKGGGVINENAQMIDFDPAFVQWAAG